MSNLETEMSDPKVSKPRGFATLDADAKQRIASMGGKTAHAKGTAHKWTTETAAAAGRKGGETRARRMAERQALRQANAVATTQQAPDDQPSQDPIPQVQP